MTLAKRLLPDFVKNIKNHAVFFFIHLTRFPNRIDSTMDKTPSRISLKRREKTVKTWISKHILAIQFTIKRRMEFDMIFHTWNVFNTESLFSIQYFIVFINFNNLTWFYLVYSADDILKSHIVCIVGRSYVRFEFTRRLQNSASLSFQRTSDADASLSHSTNITKVPQFLTRVATYCSFGVIFGVPLGNTG